MTGTTPPNDTARSPARTSPGTTLLGLLRRRTLLVPTWRGWLALLVIAAASTLFVLRHAHGFLAVSEPVAGGALVVEGWAPDYVLEQAIAEFKRGRYRKLYVTGGPIEAGAPLAEYRSYAERGAAVVLKLGLDPSDVQAVPAPAVRQDRTYAAMVALRQWLEVHGSMPAQVHLVTRGPHARRSRSLLQYAFGDQVEVGVTAVPTREYDAAEWWRSSAGVREVIGEALAYGYVLWFAPEPEVAPSP